MEYEFQYSMIGKLYRARVALEQAISAVSNNYDPIVAEQITIAEGHLAAAQIQWRERPQ